MTSIDRRPGVIALLLLVGCGGEAVRIDGHTLAEWQARLQAENARDRVAAIDRIARFGAAGDDAVDALAARLAATGDVAERTAAGAALVAIATADAKDAVRELLASAVLPPAAFAEAAAAGAALLEPGELDALLRAARPTQIAATLVSERTFEAALPPGPRRRELLLALAASGAELDPRAEDAVVRRLATLGAGAAPAVPFVATALAHGRDEDACVATLVAIGDATAAQALLTHLDGTSPARRAAGMPDLGAMLATGGSGAPVARAALHDALGTTDRPALARAAAAVLGSAGGAPDFAPLVAQLDSDTLAGPALDATIELVAREAVPAKDAFAAWRDAAARAQDPVRARAIVRAFVRAGREPGAAASTLAPLARSRPELADSVLTALDDLAKDAPDAAFAASAAVLATPELADRATRTERFLRRLEATLRTGSTPEQRAAAARRLALDAPERATVPVRIGSQRYDATLVLGAAAATVSAAAGAALHVPAGSVPVAWRVDDGVPVVWIGADGRRVGDASAARCALALSAGAAPQPGADVVVDAALLQALAR